MRAPLLYPSLVVIHRLDIIETHRTDLGGVGGLSSGYDPDLREPIAYTDANNKRVLSTKYMAPVQIPCQVEVKKYEELRQVFQGNAPVTQMVFVLHNKDLKKLGLLKTDAGCAGGRRLLLKTNDKITAVLCKRRRIPSIDMAEPIFIYRIDPGSWGMGPTGNDLRIVYTTNRPALPTG